MLRQAHLPAHLILLFSALAGLFIWPQLNGSGGDGDSVMHYYFAASAFDYPLHFLDLWAKPAFTTLAAPWAVFGFKYLQLFNFFNALGASYFAYRIARHFKLKLAPLAMVIPWLCRAYFPLSFTGLTEPLAALCLSAGVFALLKNKLSWGFIILSLLPFIRFEMYAVLFWLMLAIAIEKRTLKSLWGLSALVVLAFFGLAITGNFLAYLVSPYGQGVSPYGSGDWYHFLERLIALSHPSWLVAAALGMAASFLKTNYRKELLFLVVGPIIIITLGHSLVWALGIFASAGMDRVLIPIFPLIFVLAVLGIEKLGQIFDLAWLKWFFTVLFLALPLLNYWYDGGLWRYYWASVKEKHPRRAFIENEFEGLKPRNSEDYLILSDPYSGIALDLPQKGPQTYSFWTIDDLVRKSQPFVFLVDDHFSLNRADEIRDLAKLGLVFEKEALYTQNGDSIYYFQGYFNPPQRQREAN
jgi:hypothetical protein